MVAFVPSVEASDTQAAVLGDHVHSEAIDTILRNSQNRLATAHMTSALKSRESYVAR